MYITINSSDYWMETYGIGPPVFLFHGFTGSTSTWEELLPVLQTEFQVYLIDLPGHGRTKTSSPLDMEQFCQEFCQLLDCLKIKKIHLIGYSLGGRIALSFANFFPERVASLVLESSSPGLETEIEREKRRQSDQQLSELLIRHGIEAFVKKWENLPLFHTQKLLPEEKQKKIREERLSHQPKGLAASLDGMGTGSQPSWWENLEKLFLPVLLLAGERDKKFLLLNKRMSTCLPQADFFVFSEGGHSLHVEQPEVFGTIVYDFLSKHRDNFRTEG